jgi:hypothetical protein
MEEEDERWKRLNEATKRKTKEEKKLGRRRQADRFPESLPVFLLPFSLSITLNAPRT